ncbi:sugar kinase [Streptomyces sp. NPDC087440]|uniref:sugar kinase n=1 Tax=Streptomyces sp. NPDC087440 TaxID=3365790 RepID=UPI0037F7BE85
MSPEVVVYGEAMLLMLAEPGIPLERAVAFRRSVAGAESNVAAGLARLGHPVRWLGRVGDDPAGRAVLGLLRAEGIDTTHAVVDPEAPTGLLLRDSHPARGIDVQYYRAGSAASRLSARELTPEALGGARLLHVTGITPMLSAAARRATLRLFDLADAAGVRISFDPNVRLKLGAPEQWREVVAPLLARADVVLAGEDELEVLGVRNGAAGVLTAQQAALAGRRGVQDWVARAATDRPPVVVVKHRDKSATCLTPEGSWTHPAFSVPVVDPVGAGDAFAAGFLSALLREAPYETCLREAAAVAALVVQCATDTDGLPDRRGLERALTSFGGDAETVNR